MPRRFLPYKAPLVRGALRSARLCDARRGVRNVRRRAVDRRESFLHARRRKPGSASARPEGLPCGDIIQVDPPQAYGIVQYARTLDMLARHGWPRVGLFPHGGNQMSLHIAGGLRVGRHAESYPGVFGAFAGFAADDAKLENGYLKLPDRPGIGFRGSGGALSHHERPRRIDARRAGLLHVPHWGMR